MKKIIGLLTVALIIGVMPLQALNTEVEKTNKGELEVLRWRDCIDEYELELELGYSEAEADAVFNDCIDANNKEMDACCD
ncbi:hypothetical protein [uncultured Formosa sp.]|uniref:hypothetical protein n=1 Tax=uncultured Formosa sp. TaxID=255435 RepID=UPI00263480FA|nr:hypothetical protein [uncultured Formosa sp.]